ncbi:hypothetical protein BC835DRAFT_1437233 [Cytidiella melzeri]|nr:hypothetical protein BC835DRAFT_1437233 [Cytidiella melzeri]
MAARKLSTTAPIPQVVCLQVVPHNFSPVIDTPGTVRGLDAQSVFQLIRQHHSHKTPRHRTHSLSAALDQHDSIHNNSPATECIVVPIEVTDTGCGIRQKDMVQSNFFSVSLSRLALKVDALVQTRSIRLRWAGNKVASVRVPQIVKLLGVCLILQFRLNEGLIFLAELLHTYLADQIPNHDLAWLSEHGHLLLYMVATWLQVALGDFALNKTTLPQVQILNRETTTKEDSPTSVNSDLRNTTSQIANGVRPNYQRRRTSRFNNRTLRRRSQR